MLFVFALFNADAQYTLKGIITDQGGKPMAGVNVSDSVTIVASDSTGQFALTSERSSAALVFTYVGYAAHREVVRSEDFVVIKLSPADILLEQVVVTAFDHNSSIKRAPFAVSILSKSELSRYGNVSLVPAMNSVPGVRMDERSPGSYRLNIRGNLLRSTFGVRNVKIYWNDIPFTDANGNAYLQQVPFNSVDKVEIIKGPSGSMYGSGTGGVVLITSSPGVLQEKYVELQSVIGSYGLRSFTGAYKNRNDKSGSSFSISHQESDGYRRHTNFRRDVVNYSSAFRVSDKQNIDLSLFYSDLYYQTPGGLTTLEQKTDPQQSRPAAGPFRSAMEQKAALYVKTIFAGISHGYVFSDHVSNKTSLVVNHTKFKNPAIRNYERKTEQGMSLRSVSRFSRGRFSSILGGEYQYSFNNTATYGNRRGMPDTLQYQDEIGSRQFNGFLQAAMEVRGLKITAGISYNNFHYRFLRISDAGSPEESSNFRPQFVPRFSLSYNTSDKMNVYASLSKGYSPPSIDEVHASDGNFNRSLRAEFALNYEAGIKVQPIAGKLYADVVFYYFNLRNTIVSRRDASGAEFYVNAGKTKQRGIEISSNYLLINNNEKLFSRLNFWSSATLIRARFADYQQGTNKFDGNKLTGTAPHVFVLGTDMHAWKMFGNFSYTYTGAIPLNDANTFYSTRYNLYSVKVGYIGGALNLIQPTIFVAYEGTANAPYSLGNDLNAAGNRFYNPSAPHTFSLGASFKMNVRKQNDK